MNERFSYIWFGEHSGSVVESLTRDPGAAGLSPIGVTVLCPWARHIYPSLVLYQPRKTRPNITEKRVYWDVKNQIKQTNTYFVGDKRNIE